MAFTSSETEPEPRQDASSKNTPVNRTPLYRRDELLLWEVRRRTDGANVHRVNNALVLYYGGVDLLNEALLGGESSEEEVQVLAEKLKRITKTLQIFVNTGVLERSVISSEL